MMLTDVSQSSKARKAAAVALPSAAPEPLMVRVAEAVRLTGISRSDLYRRARLGEVIFLKCGKVTLIDYQSLKALVMGLPRAKINVQS